MDFISDVADFFFRRETEPAVLSVKTLLKRAKDAHKLPKDKLWQEAHDVGLVLCFAGFSREAVRLWKFVYELKVPSESRTIYGDGAISAICLALKERDISGGKPASTKISEEQSLDKRVDEMHNYVMDGLSCHIWGRLRPEARTELPLLYNLIDGRRFCRTWLKSGDQESLQNSIQQFQQFISANSTTSSSEGLSGCLLASELAAQAQDESLSETFLLRFLNGSNHQYGYLSLNEALCLKSVATSACSGKASSVFGMSNAQAKIIVEELCAGMRARMQSIEPDYKPQARMKFSAPYNSFFIEPRESKNVEYSNGSGESFALVDNHLSIALPTETEQVDLRVASSNTIDTRGAVQAFVVPIEVKDEPALFVRTIYDLTDDNPIIAPLGKHDLLVAIYKLPPSLVGRLSELDRWKVVLTFLPGGTTSPGILVEYDDD